MFYAYRYSMWKYCPASWVFSLYCLGFWGENIDFLSWLKWMMLLCIIKWITKMHVTISKACLIVLSEDISWDQSRKTVFIYNCFVAWLAKLDYLHLINMELFVFCFIFCVLQWLWSLCLLFINKCLFVRLILSHGMQANH